MEATEAAPAETSSTKKSEPKKTFVLKKWTGVALWHFGDDTNSDCGICRSSKQDYCTLPLSVDLLLPRNERLIGLHLRGRLNRSIP
jgi:hypothetical protein